MVSFDSFLNWANSRFGGDVVVKNNEIKINSIFVPDTKHHLACNPYGGKHRREHGCYRCFYTDKKGTLVGLVMQVDGCSHEEALDVLSGRTPIRVLEEELDKFFEEGSTQRVQEKIKVSNFKLPAEAVLIEEMPASSIFKMDAESYLKGRKLPLNGFYFCVSGDYKSRIIIPYYNHEGELIYFNGRHINGKAKLRYMGPDKSVGVGKGDVLYFPFWPPIGSKIYLTEGELDAYSLYLSGLYGAACGGKDLTERHVSIIKSRGYKVCVALDMDEKVQEASSPGFTGLLKMAEKLIAASVQVTFVRPPHGIKDWNKMLVTLNEAYIKAYIEKAEKVVDSLAIIQMECSV